MTTSSFPNSPIVKMMKCYDKVVTVPNIDVPLIDQPYTYVRIEGDQEPSFKNLFRISNCGGGFNLEDKLCEFNQIGSSFIFSLNESICQTREKLHATTSSDESEPVIFPGNKIQILMRKESCSCSESTILLLRLCDCKHCEGQTLVDSTTLKQFDASLQLSCGDASMFVTLSLNAACTDTYNIGRKNQPGNYKQLLYYAFLNRKSLMETFKTQVFSKTFEGPPPTIRFLVPQVKKIPGGTKYLTDDTVPTDELLRWMYYKHETLLKSPSMELVVLVLDVGLKYKILEMIATSSKTLREKIEMGQLSHPPELWKLYGMVRYTNAIEIVVMLKMTVVKALRKIVFRKKY